MLGNDVDAVVDRMYIGGTALHNLETLVHNMSLTGGLKRYTLSRGYFYNNISNNIAGGLMGRYGYGNYIDASARDKIDGTDGVFLQGDHLQAAGMRRDRIGDYYTTNLWPESNYKSFLRIEDFSLLGDLLRRENLRNNPKTDYAKKRYSDEGGEEKFIAYDVYSPEIGEEGVYTYFDSDYNALFGNRPVLNKTGKPYRDAARIQADAVSDSAGFLDVENGVYRAAESSTQVYQGEIAPVLPRYGTKKFKPNVNFGSEFEHNIYTIGDKVRAKYSGFRINNNYISSHPNVTVLKGVSTQAEYGNEYSVSDAFSDLQISEMEFNKVPDTGIIDYYEDARDIVNTNRKYHHTNSYGVNVWSNTDEGIYTVPEHGLSTYFAASSHTIDRKYIGTLRTIRRTTRGLSDTHIYYNEVDGGSPVSSFKDKSNVMDLFNPDMITPRSETTRLIDKTNQLFRSNKVKSLINRFHTDVQDDFENDELITAYKPNFGLSRGRNLLRKQYEDAMSGDKSTGFDDPYCRVWTAHYQYSKMKDRIRPFMDGGNFMSIKDLQANYGNLRPNGSILSDYTTLEDSGFVKITPYKNTTVGGDDIKRYMFSIENLAWKGFANTKSLSKEQIGPNGGRIMWFPPYNLKFQENVNTSWRDNEFIGRGEKIYTYANTDRNGTLSFTLLIDHPSIVDKWAGSNFANDAEAEQDLLRFFAGCGPLTVNDEPPIIPTVEEFGPEDNKEDTTPTPNPKSQYYYARFIMFFPNNFSAKDYVNNIPEAIRRLDEYEMSSDGVANFKEMDDAYKDEILAKYNYDNFSLFSLNTQSGIEENSAKIGDILGYDIEDGFLAYENLKRLGEFFSSKKDGSTSIFGHDTRDYELDGITVEGFASDHGHLTNNRKLCRDRANMIKKIAMYYCGQIEDSQVSTGKTNIIQVREVEGKELVNDIEAKIARSASITFKIKLREDAKPANEGTFVNEDGKETSTVETTVAETSNATAEAASGSTDKGETKEVIIHHNDISPEGAYTYQNEYLYFKSIEAKDNFVYKNIVDKVRHFEPAFHSLTPEGFNARLNFLHQCTRQGPTIGSHAGEETPDGQKTNMTKMAGNLAFGMAPYCVLRVGDFFYSKICIDAISISYETGGGVQWDLNPEGSGVQPMMADISLNFHFIGGQNLDGPVAQLQNAISHNYYANSSVYTPPKSAVYEKFINGEIKKAEE